MAINLDLVIESDEDSVDMKAGLTTMQGISDSVRCIAESVLTENVPERKTSKSKVRTRLKKSFKGSYGHTFSLDVFDPELQKKLRSIGRPTFIELISYFISESLYQESKQLSEKAHKIIDGLGEVSEDILKQLRKSSMKNIHEMPTKFNHNVKVRFRKSNTEQKIIAEFDKSTAMALQAIVSEEIENVSVVITRLNIHTGNGRLQINGEHETVAFGFGAKYKDVKLKAKKIFSENLDYNNGLDSSKWKYLKIRLSPIKLRDGKIIKYIVKGFYEN